MSECKYGGFRDAEAAHDAVNSPSHYASGEIECIRRNQSQHDA